ncbi:hypothetical protein BESB_071200 [Besnoitia besnoiti]|uniref:Uncharacterized protein n=1 Tax=Besnoitia besnoiti TaxID=94643 RepID=A0A2A9M666_BESBE|nr:uncharacterized protein BESB_071200 [Besnoitia besnoiti]PFH33968.1 hypothetical protein BESB_071200 [Besnoitia besnoiti]
MMSSVHREPRGASAAKTAASLYKEQLGFFRKGVASTDDIHAIKQLNLRLLDAVEDSKFKLRHNELKAHLENTLAAINRLEGNAFVKTASSSPAVCRASSDCRSFRKSPHRAHQTPRVARRASGSPPSHRACDERHATGIAIPPPPICPRGPPVFAPVQQQRPGDSLQNSPDSPPAPLSLPWLSAHQCLHPPPPFYGQARTPLPNNAHPTPPALCGRLNSSVSPEADAYPLRLRHSGCPACCCSEEAAANSEKCRQLALQLSHAQEERARLVSHLSQAQRENEDIRAVYEAKLHEVRVQLESCRSAELPELEAVLAHAESLAEHVEQMRRDSYTWSACARELLQHLQSVRARSRCPRRTDAWDPRYTSTRDSGSCFESHTETPCTPFAAGRASTPPSCRRTPRSPPCCEHPAAAAGAPSPKHGASGPAGRPERREGPASPGARLWGRRNPRGTEGETENRAASPCCSVTLDAAEVEAVRARAGCAGPILLVRDVEPQLRESDCDGPRRRVLRDPQIFDYVT